ncbi:MAG: 6-carboxytetrahydropterin synthase [Acetobacteraceae bacterium]|nr:6-carboxytetrahydropterin synthase [Acetobacteraceae bacterium]
MLETYCEFTFDAAHKTTPDTPLHGHSFRVRVTFAGTPQPVVGWSHDLTQVEGVVEGVRRRLDHTCLNDIEGLDTPTLENVARWIWLRIAPQIEGLDRVEVSRGVMGRSEGVVLRNPA